MKKISELPIFNPSEKYGGGRILLIEFQKKFFLRNGEGIDAPMHRDIALKFQRELLVAGFYSGKPIVRGGAWIKIDPSKKEILISGHSMDYGECDKSIVKEIILGVYPNYEIIIF